MEAIKNSTKGYWRDMGFWQYLHLPFKKSQLNTGTRSRGLSLWLQLGQADGGKITEVFVDILSITTLLKLPRRLPKTKKTMV